MVFSFRLLPCRHLGSAPKCLDNPYMDKEEPTWRDATQSMVLFHKKSDSIQENKCGINLINLFDAKLCV